MSHRFAKKTIWSHIYIFMLCIAYIVKHRYRSIKWFIQRGVRGYSEADIWEMDAWFCRVFPSMLRELSKQLNKVPQIPYPLLKEIREIPNYESYTEEEMKVAFDNWMNILNEMINCFEKANRRDESLDFKEKEAQKDKGFELLKTYFYELWW